MSRPTLEDIFSEPDEFGLLEVNAKAIETAPAEGREQTVLRDVGNFYKEHGRLPDPDALGHEEMRLGTIWQAVSKSPSEALHQADEFGVLSLVGKRQISWRDEPQIDDVPEDLDDIFDNDELSVDAGLLSNRYTTRASDRHLPDHRAEFVACQDFEAFSEKFDRVQSDLEAGIRKAIPVKKWAVIEPIEGDFFIRNGLLALIAEKSEMSARGGSRDHRLRVIFANGTESDPLMSSFRKSLNDDQAARMLERIGYGPLDPDWESDQLELSGTIYVARSLSDDPAISKDKSILHKIGVTSQDVRRRVADARNDPTFLLAPVEIAATFDLKNLPRRKVEDLLHRFFDAARPAELFIVDRFGKKVRPKEWFYVLPEHVSIAANLIQEGTLHNYYYDPASQKIIARKG